MPNVGDSLLHRALWLAPLSLGCNVLLTDWSVAESDPAGSGASAATTGTGGAGGDALVPATPLQQTPLGPDVLADGVAIHREGYFRIEADPQSNWQWARWFYLPSDPDAHTALGPVIYGGSDTPYYRTTCLWSAVRGHAAAGQTGYSMRSCNYTHRQDESPFVGEPTLDGDALPAWFTLFGEVDAVWNASVTFNTRVFASGRVWTHTHVVYDELSLGETEISFGHVALEAEHFFLPEADEDGLFEMKMGGGALLGVDPGPRRGAAWVTNVTGLEADGVMGAWEVTEDLQPGSVKDYTFAFFLGPAVKLGSERAARALDLQSPDLEIGDGATTLFAASGGFDPRTGTYSLDRAPGADTIEFSLGAAVKRFEPAFEISGWQSTTWVIRLGEEVLASDAGQGPDILAAHTGDRLVFQHLGAIDAGAPLAARTFTVSED